jgi:hypothetical protein
MRRLTPAEIRRAFYALVAVGVAEVIGTVGFHVIEGAGWVNAFYFESMLATGQGPPFQLFTDTGKIFASIMGFVSVGSTLSAVVFVVGPLVIRMWHEGIEAAAADARRLEQGATRDFQRLGHELTGEGARDERPPTGPPP